MSSIFRFLALIAICGQLLSCSYLNIDRVEGTGPDPSSASFSGLKSLLTNSPLASVLVVHGFGPHPPGYSQSLRERISGKLHTTEYCGDPQPIMGGNYGYITVCAYKHGNSELRFYELSWTNLTEGLRKYYLGVDHEGRDRLWVNRTVKDFFFYERFSDAVLYVGQFKTEMQKPIAYALCLMFNDRQTAQALQSQIGPGDACNSLSEADLERKSREHNAIGIVTESLGSTMVWETLVAMHGPGSDTRRREVAGQVVGNTRTVYMLANQLPFLSLGYAEDPMPSGSASIAALNRSYPVFPEGIEKLLRTAKSLRKQGQEVIDVVAFNDPNDLLGYYIPQDLVKDKKDYLRVINATISVAKWGYLFILANPYMAHTGHIDNDKILEMVVCGFPAQCAMTN